MSETPVSLLNETEPLPESLVVPDAIHRPALELLRQSEKEAREYGTIFSRNGNQWKQGKVTHGTRLWFDPTKPADSWSIEGEPGDAYDEHFQPLVDFHTHPQIPPDVLEKVFARWLNHFPWAKDDPNRRREEWTALARLIGSTPSSPDIATFFLRRKLGPFQMVIYSSEGIILMANNPKVAPLPQEYYHGEGGVFPLLLDLYEARRSVYSKYEEDKNLWRINILQETAQMLSNNGGEKVRGAPPGALLYFSPSPSSPVLERVQEVHNQRLRRGRLL